MGLGSQSVEIDGRMVEASLSARVFDFGVLPSGLAYLAMGDWHRQMKINERFLIECKPASSNGVKLVNELFATFGCLSRSLTRIMD